MPTRNPTIVEDVERKSGTSSSRFRTIANVLAVLLIGSIALALVLPALQTAGHGHRSRAWRNLHQIGLSLGNYHYKHGAYPYDSRGADYALYLLYADAQANGWTLDATFFDSHPHERPRPDARWDHAAGRIIDSDFDYWNNPDLDEAHFKRCLYGCPTVVVVERSDPDDKWLMLSTTDARIHLCDIPDGDPQKLFGSLWTSEGFLIANRELFDEWEQVQLPSVAGSMSVSSNNRLDHQIAGDATTAYAYRGDHLESRNWTAPAGMITESVMTDEIGRITGFTREPADWRTFWPWQRKGD